MRIEIVRATAYRRERVERGIAALRARGKLAIDTTGSKEIDELVKSCIKVNPVERLSAARVRDALAKYLAARMPA